MRRIILSALIAALAPTAHAQLHRDRTTSITIVESTEIQGYPCAKGTVSFYDEGKLRACKVARDTPFGEAVVPAGSGIHLLPNGSPSFVFLQHNTVIRGHTCRGRDTDYMTTFYPDGNLKVCWLASDEVIEGVPCRKAAVFVDVFGVGEGTRFYDTGRLKSCRLASEFAVEQKHFNKGERVFLGADGKLAAGAT